MPYMDCFKEYEKWRMRFYSPKSTWGYYETSAETIVGIFKRLFNYSTYLWPMKNIRIYRRPKVKCPHCKGTHYV